MDSTSLAHRPLQAVADVIADPEQIGGGGIAAALSAVLGISAAELVLRLARGRKSMRANQKAIDAHLAALAGHRTALTEAADEEVEILAQLLKLWSVRSDPDHNAEYVASLEAAIDSPLQAVGVVADAARHIRESAQYATTFTVSDMHAALAMLVGAAQAFEVTAMVNVDLLAEAAPDRDVEHLRHALRGARAATEAQQSDAVQDGK